MTAANENTNDDPIETAPTSEPADVETTVGTAGPRAPIADVGSAAYGGADVYSGDDAFEAPRPFEGVSVFEAEPALGVADAYEGPSGIDAIGAYEPDGAYTPTVTPVAAEEIVPAGAATPGDGAQPARVDPIGVYVPEDVPAASLPNDEIARSESAVADVAANGAEPLPPTAVDAETGAPALRPDTTSGPGTVRFDD